MNPVLNPSSSHQPSPAYVQGFLSKLAEWNLTRAPAPSKTHYGIPAFSRSRLPDPAGSK